MYRSAKVLLPSHRGHGHGHGPPSPGGHQQHQQQHQLPQDTAEGLAALQAHVLVLRERQQQAQEELQRCTKLITMFLNRCNASWAEAQTWGPTATVSHMQAGRGGVECCTAQHGSSGQGSLRACRFCATRTHPVGRGMHLPAASMSPHGLCARVRSQGAENVDRPPARLGHHATFLHHRPAPPPPLSLASRCMRCSACCRLPLGQSLVLPSRLRTGPGLHTQRQYAGAQGRGAQGTATPGWDGLGQDGVVQSDMAA